MALTFSSIDCSSASIVSAALARASCSRLAASRGSLAIFSRSASCSLASSSSSSSCFAACSSSSVSCCAPISRTLAIASCWIWATLFSAFWARTFASSTLASNTRIASFDAFASASAEPRAARAPSAENSLHCRRPRLRLRWLTRRTQRITTIWQVRSALSLAFSACSSWRAWCSLCCSTRLAMKPSCAAVYSLFSVLSIATFASSAITRTLFCLASSAKASSCAASRDSTACSCSTSSMLSSSSALDLASVAAFSCSRRLLISSISARSGLRWAGADCDCAVASSGAGGGSHCTWPVAVST
mmetsp:Transcript_109588/g.318360  ORF Transcript_109588/g.318360 Transcript_109588/m.318360 type:complete len:302 (-) Transcript_109588:896-1801(-)